MGALAIGRGLGAERQRPFTREADDSEPATDERTARDHQIQLEAAGTVDLFQQRRDPCKAPIVQRQVRLSEASGEALPEIAGIDRVAVVAKIGQRQELELVEILGLPDQQDLAPQCRLFDQRTGQQQARIVEPLDREHGLGPREQRALDESHLPAHAGRNGARLDILE